jgi:hypothetical protein
VLLEKAVDVVELIVMSGDAGVGGMVTATSWAACMSHRA